MSRIVLFGATGYTGVLTAHALVAQGARPLLAARSQAKLDALAQEVGGGLETAVADVDDPRSVRALLEPGDVLLTCVGPFARWGGVAIEAAIDAGAHYVDSTGEPQFIRRVFEHWDGPARTAGVGLLTAFGYDWVPGNLAGALALREAGPAATSVEVGYFMTGKVSGDAMSGGTRASAAGALLEPGHAWRGGRIVTERGSARVRSFETTPGREQPGISIGGSEHFALPRLHPGLQDVDVLLGWFGPLSRPMQVMSAGTALATKLPGVRAGLGAAVGRFVKGSTGGPDEAARSGTGSVALGEAFSASGERLSRVRLEGVNGYDFTARVLAWGARAAWAGGLQGTGALGPADGFGLDALEAGAAEAGLRRVD